jgi:hypothetical protein
VGVEHAQAHERRRTGEEAEQRHERRVERLGPRPGGLVVGLGRGFVGLSTVASKAAARHFSLPANQRSKGARVATGTPSGAAENVSAIGALVRARGDLIVLHTSARW